MKKRIFSILICGYISTFLICSSQTQAAIKASAKGVIIDTGNRDVDRFVYELTEWVNENKNKVIQGVQDLEDSTIMQKIDLVTNTSLFAYYLTDYYNSHAAGAGLIEPTGSAMSGIYKIENDDRLYSASVYTIDSNSGGLLASSAHYSMAIRFEAVNYEGEYTVNDLISNMTQIKDAFHVGTQFNISAISNTSLRIYYNGTGLFNSSTYLSGAVQGYQITAYLNPNKGSIPIITQGYNWGNTAIMNTGYGSGLLTIPEATASDSTPWDYYNNNLLPQILEQYPDLVPDDFPFHGEPFRPATVTDPTEPETTKPRYELETIPDLWQPVTEIIEITNDSSEVVETQIETVTDTNGQPISEPKMPMLPTIPIDIEPFPDWFIPLDLWDTITGIWEAMRNTMEETELMNLLPFVMIVGLIGFGLKYIGG